MKVIAMLLSLGLVAPAFANNVPSQDDIMPVVSEVDGQTRAVVAKKDGDYFPVFIKKGGQPYFADASGKTHYVYNTKTQKGHDIFVEKNGSFLELTASSASSKSELKFAKGDESITQPVTFGYRRFYRARYYRWNRPWRFYPRYHGGFYNYGFRYNYQYSFNYSYYRPYYGYGCYIY